MHSIYAKLEADGVLGPFEMKNGQKVPRPFQEYPKWVTKADGKRLVVKDLTEEIAVVGEEAVAAPGGPPDPLADNKRKLVEATEAAMASKRELDEATTRIKAMMAEIEAQRGTKFAPPAQEVAKPAKRRGEAA